MGKVQEYVKRPVKIEAIQWSGANEADIWAFTGQHLRLSRPPHQADHDHDNIPDSAYAIFIPTLEGEMRCDRGDYVIKGVAGEFYPCKPDIFNQTYSSVESIAAEKLKEREDYFALSQELAAKDEEIERLKECLKDDGHEPNMDAEGRIYPAPLPDTKQEAIVLIEHKFNELLNGDANISDRLSAICSKAALDSMYTEYAQTINPTESYLVATCALIAWELQKRLEQKQKEV